MRSGRSWTRENLRHVAGLLHQGRNPAATVYDSLGPDFFLALDDGWLNLGLWEDGDGFVEDAPAAVRRLVRAMAEDLPTGGTILDVGNGLAAQDPLIAEIARPRRLIALNITRSQLVAGRERLAEANAVAVNGDATRIPIADAGVDGVISVEAAFHFRSRARFLGEAVRVMRSGAALAFSDIPVLRTPRTPGELVAGVTQLRVWGLRPNAVMTPVQIATAVERAGFVDVRTELVGDRVIEPALAFVRRRLETERSAPRLQRTASRLMLRQVELLWRRGIIEYLLVRAVRP